MACINRMGRQRGHNAMKLKAQPKSKAEVDY
jgi:hypothetical protein